MKIQGTIVYFDNQRGFGFAERKMLVEGSGFHLQKYFIGRARVDFVAEDPIRVGHVARFNVILEGKKACPNDLPRAIDIDIFENEEAANTAALIERYQEAATTEASTDATEKPSGNAAGLNVLTGGGR